MPTDLSYWGRCVPRRSLLAAGGSTVFLAACGGSSNNNPAGKSTAGTATTPAAPASAAGTVASAASPAPAHLPGKPGGTLRYHLPKEPGNLDPHLATDSSTTAFADLAYNSLLRFKTGANLEVQDVQLESELADKWETPDPQTDILYIRPDVKWQNKAPLNGRAFTAEDAKWGALRIGTDMPEFQRATFFKGIDKIDVTDANTIVIKQQRNLADKIERKKVLVEIQKQLARANWRIGMDQAYEFVGWYSKVKGWRALAADPGYCCLPFEGALFGK